MDDGHRLLLMVHMESFWKVIVGMRAGSCLSRFDVPSSGVRRNLSAAQRWHTIERCLA